MSSDRLAQLLLIFVGVSGCFSVLFGAWLAHGSQMLAIEQQTRLTTAVQYQFIHTLALLASLLFYRMCGQGVLLVSSCLFTVGIICFSGSLYIKVFLEVTWLAKVTPLGGISFAFAWLLIGLGSKGVFKK